MTRDPFWDEPFHAIAFAAFVEVAIEAQGWPDPEKTRQRAYAMHEAKKREVDTIKNPR